MRGVTAKIAFIGTHGVGKTVLTFSLASRLRMLGLDADVVSENSRRSPFPINEGTTFESQMWILATQWQAELEAIRRCKLLICDRGVVDNYAYMERACGPQTELVPFLERWSRTYDLLFWIPIIDASVVADSMRSTALPFQREIHRRVGELVERFQLGDRVVRLAPHRDAHMNQILDAMNANGMLPRRQETLF